MRVVRKTPLRRGHLHRGRNEVREEVRGCGRQSGVDSGQRQQQMQKLPEDPERGWGGGGKSKEARVARVARGEEEEEEEREAHGGELPFLQISGLRTGRKLPWISPFHSSGNRARNHSGLQIQVVARLRPEMGLLMSSPLLLRLFHRQNGIITIQTTIISPIY